MKIAMIGHKRIPGREGGIEVVVEELSSRLTNKGIDVVAYNRRKKGYKSPPFYKGIELKDVFTIEKKSTDAIIYSFLTSVLVSFSRCSVIHYHGIGPSLFLFIPLLFRKKIIVTVHGLNYKTPKWKGIGEKILKLGEIISAKFAHKIIVLSKAQQLYFKNKYNRETVYIPNGTVIKDIEPPSEITKKYDLTKDSYILFVSRVVPGKGLEYLIDAFVKLNTNKKLVIAGDSPFMNEYRNNIIEKTKTDPRIKFVGHVEGKVLQELYSNARLFVFPSEAEGMPMCLLEALSYDCPCLVSDIPENIDFAGNFVTSFKSCDIDDLKLKLDNILRNKKCNKHSRAYIEANYSWNNVVDDVIACYRDI